MPIIQDLEREIYAAKRARVLQARANPIRERTIQKITSPFQARIDHEDNLINQRFTWLLLSQSFLIIALIYIRNDAKFFCSFNGSRFADTPLFYIEMELLTYSIIVIGGLIAYYTSRSIAAAFKVRIVWRRLDNLKVLKVSKANPSAHKDNECEEKPIISAHSGTYLIGILFSIMWVVILFFEIFSLHVRGTTDQLVFSIVFYIVALFVFALYLDYHYQTTYGKSIFENPTQPPGFFCMVWSSFKCASLTAIICMIVSGILTLLYPHSSIDPIIIYAILYFLFGVLIIINLFSGEHIIMFVIISLVLFSTFNQTVDTKNKFLNNTLKASSYSASISATQNKAGAIKP